MLGPFTEFNLSRYTNSLYSNGTGRCYEGADERAENLRALQNCAPQGAGVRRLHERPPQAAARLIVADSPREHIAVRFEIKEL
jgi:hypothetical protein